MSDTEKIVQSLPEKVRKRAEELYTNLRIEELWLDEELSNIGSIEPDTDNKRRSKKY